MLTDKRHEKMAKFCGWIVGCYTLILTQGVVSGDYCWTNHGYLSSYKYCEYGCCGNYCCSDIPGLPGIVLGSVIGGLVLIAIIVTVCICYQKKKRSVGRVVHPVGYNTGPTVIMAQSNQTGGGYGYSHVTQYPPVPSQSTSQAYTVNPAAPPPYPGGDTSGYPGGVGTAYPATGGEKAPYPPQY